MKIANWRHDTIQMDSNTVTKCLHFIFERLLTEFIQYVILVKQSMNCFDCLAEKSCRAIGELKGGLPVSRITKPVEERRQEIIDTAQKSFKEKGFDKTQVADISNRMNAAQGLVYHYFKSKRDILYAVIDQIAAGQTERMKQKMETNSASALEGLTLLFNCRLDFEAHDKLIPSLKSDRAILEYCTQKMTASILPLLFSLIERGNADGSWNCEYPKETAVFILQGFSGLIGLPDSEAPDEAKTQAFANIIFRILDVEPMPPR
jgi:AcrR family transcriptional regulator